MCPGGGYQRTSDREAEPMALTFMAMGYHVAVLRYSCGEGVHYPTALLQLAKSMLIVREHAKRVGSSNGSDYCAGMFGRRSSGSQSGRILEKERGLMENAGRRCRAGKTRRPDAFLSCDYCRRSAHCPSFERLLGENLSNCEGLLEEQSLEKHVSKDVPVTFLWHTLTDTTVPVQNSLLFLSALCNAHVPAGISIYIQKESMDWVWQAD